MSHVTQHPDFNRFTYDNDIAVLRLAEPIPEHLYRSACLPGELIFLNLFPKSIIKGIHTIFRNY